MATAGGHLALAPELDEFRRQFEQISAEADAITAGLTDDQYNWRPSGDRWSIAQCIEHLNATTRVDLPWLDEAIAEGIRRGLYGEGPFTYGWLGRFFAWFLEPPARLRTRAPKSMQPPDYRPRKESMAAFRAYQVQYVDRLRQSNGLDLARATMRVTGASWLRIPIGSGFAATLAHERRHLWQARQVLSAPGFPHAAGTRR